MAAQEPPLRFDVGDLVGRFSRTLRKSIGKVTLNLPFGSVEVDLTDKERKAAREVLIRLSNHRVLNGGECCDNCVRDSLDSLKEVRRLLTDEMVKLADVPDAPLYALLDMMRDGIKQFMTYTERLDHASGGSWDGPRLRRPYRPYSEALSVLRRHLGSCIDEIAKLAGQKRVERISGYEPAEQWIDTDVTLSLPKGAEP